MAAYEGSTEIISDNFADVTRTTREAKRKPRQILAGNLLYTDTYSLPYFVTHHQRALRGRRNLSLKLANSTHGLTRQERITTDWAQRKVDN